MSEADDQTNKAFPKPFNSSDSTALALPCETLAPVIVPAPQAERAVAQHLSCLLKELEASRQTIQRQQNLIETLTAQLESSQERFAQLERECSYIQDSYNQQSYQLIQIENNCRELRTRLTRQQCHTLQFKVALEKCSEVPVTSYQSQVDDNVISFTTGFISNSEAPYSPPFLTAIEPHNLTTFCLLKAQPIPSWSAQLQFLTNEPEPILNSPSSELQNIWVEYSGSCFTAHSSILNWSAEYLSTSAEEEPLIVVETYNLNCNKAEVDPEGGCEEENASAHSGWELQTELPLKSFTLNLKLPSAVVYPLRPPKGRKSLAEIELPPFS